MARFDVLGPSVLLNFYVFNNFPSPVEFMNQRLFLSFDKRFLRSSYRLFGYKKSRQVLCRTTF